MVRQRRFAWFTAFSLVIGSVLTMWAEVNPVLGAVAITPQGTVRVAFHTFSKLDFIQLRGIANHVNEAVKQDTWNFYHVGLML